MSVRFSSALRMAVSVSTANGSALGRSVGTIRCAQVTGSFWGAMTRLRASSASNSAASARITASSRRATSDSAATTSSGAMVPTFTLIWFSSRNFWARARLLRCASRLSMA